MENTKPGILTLCLSLATAIALGALGAHALKPLMDDNQQDIWGKAVLYQLVNSVALLALKGVAFSPGSKKTNFGKLLIFIGMTLFSGTLYLLSTRHIISWPATSLIGVLTPVGGVLMISGWVLVGLGLRRSYPNP